MENTDKSMSLKRPLAALIVGLVVLAGLVVVIVLDIRSDSARDYIRPLAFAEFSLLFLAFAAFVTFAAGVFMLDSRLRPKETVTHRVATRQITTVALLCAAAYVLAITIRLTLVPAATFLRYHPGDIFIVFGGFLFGPLTAFGMAVIVAFLELVTVGVSGPIGFVMNVISTASFVCVAAFIYKKKRTILGAGVGLAVGVLFMTGTMLLWNFLVVPLFTPGITRERVITMLIPIFLPFNLLQGGTNAAAAMLLYKPIISALRKIGLVPRPSGGKRRFSIAGVLAGLFVLGTCAVVFLLLRGMQ